MLRPLDPIIGDLLSQIPYTSSLTLSLGYRASDVTNLPPGFGFLVPKRERKHLKACTFVGRKFNYRVPGNLAVLRCFLSGPALQETDESLVAIARGELKSILGLEAEPVFHTIHRWPGSMAQYTVGHAKRVEEIRARLGSLHGIYLTGNAFDGIGIPDCIRLGKQVAQQIVSSHASV